MGRCLKKRPPKSRWQSSPLSPSRYDLRGPGSSQYAARRYLADRSESSRSPSRSVQDNTSTTTEPSSPEDVPPSSKAHDIDMLDDDDPNTAVVDEMDTSEPPSHEGNSPGSVAARALDDGEQVTSQVFISNEEASKPRFSASEKGKQVASQEVLSNKGSSNPRLSPPREGLSARLFQSLAQGEAGPSSESVLRKRRYPSTPAGEGSQLGTHHRAYRTNMARPLRPILPAVSKFLHLTRSVQPPKASTSAPAMEREQSLKPRLLPQIALAPATREGRPSNFGESMSAGPNWQNKRKYPPTLENESLGASPCPENILFVVKRLTRNLRR